MKTTIPVSNSAHSVRPPTTTRVEGASRFSEGTTWMEHREASSPRPYNKK